MSVSTELFKRQIAIIKQCNRSSGFCGLFNSWCGRRSRVVEAPGERALPGSAETAVPGCPRKGKTEMKKNSLIAFFALLFAPLLSHAQGLGSIVGRVSDPAGAGVPNARVIAVQVGTGFSRTATTDAEGLYIIPSLQPVAYNLTVEAAGFSTSKENGINLLANQTLTVNFSVKLGMTTEVVTVMANALQVDTATSTLKQVIEQQRISELPLNGRNAAQLTLLVPGAVNSPNGGADQGATKTFPGAVTYSANGARQDTISYQLDGGNYVDEYTNVNQPFPFPDALQEFSVQTSNYSSEYGQNAGAVVNVITKSGPTNILTYADGSKIANQNYLIHETHVFTSSLLNDFRFSYAREKASRGPDSSVPSVQSLGSIIPFQPAAHAIQQIRVNGGFSFGDNPQAAFVRNNFTWSDDVSWVKGKHDLRFGGVIERSRVDLNNLFFQPAEFSFCNPPAPDFATTGLRPTDVVFFKFFAGSLCDYPGQVAFRQGAGEFKNDRGIFSGMYVQDSYKISRRLTVNLGLRYEPALPWREIKGRVEQFRLSGLIAGVRSTQFPNAPPGVYFPGDPGVPENGVEASWKDFAPRVGFAYDVFGNGKTSLRGGAGIFYDTRIPGIINNRFVDVTPFSPQLILSTS